jgi:histidyl-tRNA synthetase
MSGVGIFWVRPHLLGGGRIKSFPETVTESSKALFINYGDTEAFYALQAIQSYEVWYKSRIVSR